ncbi:hypothetical protein GGI42DRAFT_268772 [Trichoderma sp. SZMC 28013]
MTEPIFAESLCSQHYVPHFAPRAPGSEAIRSVHRPRKTRRPLGRAAAGPPLNNSQWSAYSTRHGDSTFSYSDKAFPASFTHHSQTHQEPNHMLQHPPFPGFENPPFQRQKRTTAEVIEVNASTITVETMPPRPREPYFVLNPEFTSIDKRHPPYTRPQHNQDFSQSRHVPSATIPRRNLDPVGGFGAGVEFGSNLNFTHAHPSTLPSNMSSAAHKNPPATVPSTRVGDVKVEDPSTITVATAPSRRKSESGRTHKREGSTIHVYQKPTQTFKENLPLHISPKKRKADTSDAQPKGREPSVKQRPEGSFTLSALEREHGSRLTSQPGGGYQTIPSSNFSKNQSRRSSTGDDQATTQLRGSKKAQSSNKLMPMIEVALAKANEQLENHTLFIYGDVGGQKSTITSQQLQQPELQTKVPIDERESVIATPPSALELDAPVEHDTITVATQNMAETIMAETITPAVPRMAEEPRTPRTPRAPKAHVFDSEAFDTMIYRQSTLRPPPGVSVQAPPRPKTPVQQPPIEDRGQYLPINPAIHYPYNRSEEWYKEKAVAIQARRGRKAWFGKVIERRRWLRAKEKAEDERNAATPKPTRIDPQPWSYDRIIDFGDVPEEELPEDVLQNPAWVKACAWHRENQAKRVLRDRAARDANREAWSQAERIMEDAKLASQRSRQRR